MIVAKTKIKFEKGIAIICREGEKETLRNASDQYGIAQTTTYVNRILTGQLFLEDTYDEPTPLIIIDAPGLKDYRLHLQAKLAAMQHVDVVLILLDKQALGVGRFANSTFQMFGDIITVFGGNAHLYDHFLIGFSCCDEFGKNRKLDFEKTTNNGKTNDNQNLDLTMNTSIFKLIINLKQ